jgi:hypothetical protein
LAVVLIIGLMVIVPVTSKRTIERGLPCAALNASRTAFSVGSATWMTSPPAPPVVAVPKPWRSPLPPVGGGGGDEGDVVGDVVPVVGGALPTVIVTVATDDMVPSLTVTFAV